MELPIKYSQAHWTEHKAAREEYIRIQEGKCWHCKEDLSGDPPIRIQKKRIDWGLFPSNFLRYPIHLQHNHDTDLTEGAVHAKCNAVLWQYEWK